ncbi:MAG TPA: UvrD-helicase domain-containing protein [Candidatus Saccharimonadales bacterium]|nr:UvrD-helicase domain-containing protein [Candidatus Saccharimonadales bacterium]
MLDLSRLSPEQRAAVLIGDGPLLILAGPGSGKTTVLAARIAYLVTARSIPPASVLALTFATKAARELRARLVALLGEAGRGVDVATFHAFGLRVIRQWPEELGFGPGPLVVYDSADAREILAGLGKQIVSADESQLPVDFLRQIERYRLGDAAIRAPTPRPVQEIAEAYEAVLRRRGAVDYPAMLALPLRLIARRPDTRRFLQDAYRHVLVDEFQDVCGAQYRFVHALAERHRNLVVVGDPAQTVFTWRGANVRFVQEFLEDFSEARVLGLNDNFRSTGRIVELATALGRPLSYARPLCTANPLGEPGLLVVTLDERAEARFVAAEIERLIIGGQIAHAGEAAILFRTNPQATELILALRERGLAYRLRSQADLLACREVRDAIAYLRLAHNPADIAALARVANVPPRGLGRIAERLRENPVSLTELVVLARSQGPRASEAVDRLRAIVDELHDRSTELPPPELLDLALAHSGYRDWLDGQHDGIARLAHLANLRQVTERSSGLASLLGDLQLDDAESGSADDAERVVLSTIHGAKGGEWRVVFVVGLEEGLLPHYRALADPANRDALVEDELRVAYVAITRPRERLYLTCCTTRRRGAWVEPRRPSRFLRGLPLVERAA